MVTYNLTVFKCNKRGKYLAYRKYVWSCMVNWPVFHYNFQFLEVKNIQKFTVNVLSAFYHIWNFSKGPRATLNCKHSSFHFAVVPGLETSPSLQARDKSREGLDWAQFREVLQYPQFLPQFSFTYVWLPLPRFHVNFASLWSGLCFFSFYYAPLTVK